MSSEVRGSTELEKLRRRSEPIPGRPGWRQTANGEEWFSSLWLEPPDVDDEPLEPAAFAGPAAVMEELTSKGGAIAGAAGVFEEIEERRARVGQKDGELERIGASVYDELADALSAALEAVGREIAAEVDRTLATVREELERELEGIRRTLHSRTDHLA